VQVSVSKSLLSKHPLPLLRLAEGIGRILHHAVIEYEDRAFVAYVSTLSREEPFATDPTYILSVQLNPRTV